MIIHDADGDRVACGIIVPKTLAVPAFTRYFSYEGNLTVQGEMSVEGVGALDQAGQVLS